MIILTSDEAERAREQAVRDRIIEAHAVKEISKTKARRSRRLGMFRAGVVVASDTDLDRIARSRIPGHKMQDRLVVGREASIVDLDHDGDPYTWEGKPVKVKNRPAESVRPVNR